MGTDSYNPGVNTSCGCCPNLGGSCHTNICGPCIGASGLIYGKAFTNNEQVPYYIPGGVPQGYDCVNSEGMISYKTHEFVSNQDYPQASGVLLTCVSDTEFATPVCTANRYVNVMVTFSDFSPGFNGCNVSGGSFILINPNYSAQAYFPWFGAIAGDYFGAASGGISLCESGRFMPEIGTDCRWEYGGADYNYFDQEAGIQRCTTMSPPCNECHTIYISAFGGGSIPSRFGVFSIVLESDLDRYNSISGNGPTGARLSITVGNIISPPQNGRVPPNCGQVSAVYAPRSSGYYLNCSGPTTMYKISERDYAENVTYGNFPATVEVEIV